MIIIYNNDNNDTIDNIDNGNNIIVTIVILYNIESFKLDRLFWNNWVIIMISVITTIIMIIINQRISKNKSKHHNIEVDVAISNVLPQSSTNDITLLYIFIE